MSASNHNLLSQCTDEPMKVIIVKQRGAFHGFEVIKLTVNIALNEKKSEVFAFLLNGSSLAANNASIYLLKPERIHHGRGPIQPCSYYWLYRKNNHHPWKLWVYNLDIQEGRELISRHASGYALDEKLHQVTVERLDEKNPNEMFWAFLAKNNLCEECFTRTLIDHNDITGEEFKNSWCPECHGAWEWW